MELLPVPLLGKLPERLGCAVYGYQSLVHVPSFSRRIVADSPGLAASLLPVGMNQPRRCGQQIAGFQKVLRLFLADAHETGKRKSGAANDNRCMFVTKRIISPHRMHYFLRFAQAMQMSAACLLTPLPTDPHQP